MVIFSNCKINFGLHILNKRPDGFHNIETVFIPVPWNDVIEIERSPKLSLEVSGIQIEGNIEDNYCIKAYKILKEKFDLPPVKLCLLKNIPTGAGLGGGSANAAYTLKLLNKFFKLGLSVSELKNYAETIGSDCPFFIDNKISLATSKGELMEDVLVDFKNMHLVIIYPGIEVNTAWAYKTLAGKNIYEHHKSLKELVKSERVEWKGAVINDFEKIVFKEFPVLSAIKQKLYEMGAIYASMSGSGSAVFGFFEMPQKVGKIALEFHLPENYVFTSQY
jgi:4-diphosphocytidyl-2-C-methyl-D-erythritol kinase